MRLIAPVLPLLFGLFITFNLPISAQSSSGELVVAWAAPDAVYTWRESNPTPQIAFNGVVVSATLSPDGDSMALTTGAGGLPENLWVVQGDEQTLVASADTLGESVIAQVQWADADTLYVNTSQIQIPFGASPNNDLWRVDVETNEIVQLRAPGAGGAFTPNADGSLLAIVSPGSFDQQGNSENEGVIRLYDPQSDTDTIVLGFQPVATGSPQAHYPRIHWTPTGDAFYVALPPSNVLYSGGETLLWRVDATGEPEQIGALEASFFGLPRWNADQSQVFYATGTASLGTVTLNLAQADGSTPQPLVESDGYIFQWAAQEDVFLWIADFDTVYSIGTPEDPLRHEIDAELIQGRWTRDNRLVFTATTDNGLELQVAQITDDTLNITTIAELTPGTNAFSAIVTD